MLHGFLDRVSATSISGWARESDTPDVPVSLLVSADDVVIARVVARNWRGDLAQAGMGSGRHGFELNPGNLLAAHRHQMIAVQRESDGMHLSGSPLAFRPAADFDDDTQAGIAAMLEAAPDPEALERRIAFLVRQTERLLQLRADHASHRAQRQNFAWRWRQGGKLVTPDPALPGTARRALVIDERMPRTGRDAGSNVILSHMAALRRLGFDVVFVASDLATDDPAAVHALGATACVPPWHGSIEEVLRREAGMFDLVYLHRVVVAGRYLPLVRAFQPRARLLFSVADLSWLRLARHAQMESRPELHAAMRRAYAAEILAAMSADAVLTHSTHEVELLRQNGVPAARIHRVLWDVETRPVQTPFSERNGVAFIGGYEHAPNVDAAHFLVESVMKLVWWVDPAIRCVLAGTAMPESVRRLAGPRVEIAGAVADLASLYRDIRLTTAPLRFGAGVKGKVVDSLAAGLPCVCSPIAAEGLGLPESFQANIGQTPEAIAARIIKLHGDPMQHQRASREAVDFIARHFTPQRLDADLEAAVGEAAIRVDRPAAGADRGPEQG